MKSTINNLDKEIVTISVVEAKYIYSYHKIIYLLIVILELR